MRLHHTIFVNLFIILKSKLRFTVPNKIPSPPHCQNLMPSVRHAQTWTVREREPQTSSVSFQQTSFELQLLVPLLIPTPALPNGGDVLQHLLRLPLRLLESQICRVTKKVFPFGFFCQKKVPGRHAESGASIHFLGIPSLPPLTDWKEDSITKFRFFCSNGTFMLWFKAFNTSLYERSLGNNLDYGWNISWFWILLS